MNSEKKRLSMRLSEIELSLNLKDKEILSLTKELTNSKESSRLRSIKMENLQLAFSDFKELSRKSVSDVENECFARNQTIEQLAVEIKNHLKTIEAQKIKAVEFAENISQQSQNNSELTKNLKDQNFRFSELNELHQKLEEVCLGECEFVIAFFLNLKL